jgi:hypothetical protein
MRASFASFAEDLFIEPSRSAQEIQYTSEVAAHAHIYLHEEAAL